MAKGDKKKVQQAVDTSVGESRRGINDLTNQMIVPTTQNMFNNYNTASGQAMTDYSDIMGQLKNYQSQNPQGPASFERVNYNRSPELNEAFGHYRNFAQTGGFSPQDIADMRARGISPIRSVYSNMQNELERQRNLQGGYSPNMAAAMTRMRGSTSQQIADAVQDVNARLAEMRQKGQMFGTEGLGGLSVRDLELGQQAQLANQRAGLETNALNRQRPDDRLQSIMAQAQLFGTTPGMANMFGDQLLNSTRNWLGATGQQQNVGQMGITGQQAVAQTPSNFETAMGRVGGIANIGASIMNPFLPGGIRPPQNNIINTAIGGGYGSRPYIPGYGAY